MVLQKNRYKKEHIRRRNVNKTVGGEQLTARIFYANFLKKIKESKDGKICRPFVFDGDSLLLLASNVNNSGKMSRLISNDALKCFIEFVHAFAQAKIPCKFLFTRGFLPIKKFANLKKLCDLFIIKEIENHERNGFHFLNLSSTTGCVVVATEEFSELEEMGEEYETFMESSFATLKIVNGPESGHELALAINPMFTKYHVDPSDEALHKLVASAVLTKTRWLQIKRALLVELKHFVSRTNFIYQNK